MSKLVCSLPPTHMTRQSSQLDTVSHLPFSEQFEAIQNQTRHHAIAESAEHIRRQHLKYTLL